MLAFTLFKSLKKVTLNVRDWNPNGSGRFVIGKGMHLTRDKFFIAAARKKHARLFQFNPQEMYIRDSLPLKQWRSLRTASGKVLYLSPSRALGDNVIIICALAALKEANPALQIGVAFVGDSFPLYQTASNLKIHPYWIGESEIGGYDFLVDFAAIADWGSLAFQPFDIEAALRDAFGVEPSTAFPGSGKPPVNTDRLSSKVFPLASTPLRTLPFETTRAIVHALAERGSVEVVLLKAQLGTDRYQAMLDRDLPPNVTVTDACRDIGELMRKIKAADYAVFADSGPSHLAKLYDTMGLTIFTSANSAPLIGRFGNLTPWQTPFQGERCSAPCGLATYLRTPAGRGGCWETLGGVKGDYERTRELWNPQEYLALMFERPVPCVVRLGELGSDVADAVRADLERRLGN